jgi:predicted metal-binding membrane protein
MVLVATPSLLEKLCSRDKLLVSVALAALTLVSWLPMLEPLAHPGVEGHLAPCCGARFGIALAMWVVMMTGMMLPSVAPMVLTHAAVMRRRAARGAPFVASGLFLIGYLLAWSGFSALAAAAQCALFRAALLDRHALAVGPWAGAVVLLAAGAFQLSAAKSSCLSHCRAPLGYFITEWREGRKCGFATSFAYSS